MPIGTETRTRIVGYIDQGTGLGLKIGIPAAGLAMIFLLVSSLTGKLHALPSIPPAEHAEITRVIVTAGQVMTYGFAVVVASLLIRFFKEEAVGPWLAIVGAALVFGSPLLFVSGLGVDRMGGAGMAKIIVDVFRAAGWICFLPGLALILRDGILRIWMGLSVRRVIESKCEKDADKRRPAGLARIYSKCWDMDFCRSFVRKVCPAFQKRKPCWRIKVGCYCDERTILKAKMAERKETEFPRELMHGVESKEPDRVKFAYSLRKQRCRQCPIYSHHQQQKYQLLSPLVFPVVGIALYTSHDRIFAGLTFVLEKTDRVMSFLAYSSGDAAKSFSESSSALATVAFVWLTVIVVSYALKLLEYLVFDLQV